MDGEILSNLPFSLLDAFLDISQCSCIKNDRIVFVFRTGEHVPTLTVCTRHLQLLSRNG